MIIFKYWKQIPLNLKKGVAAKCPSTRGRRIVMGKDRYLSDKERCGRTKMPVILLESETKTWTGPGQSPSHLQWEPHAVCAPGTQPTLCLNLEPQMQALGAIERGQLCWQKQHFPRKCAWRRQERVSKWKRKDPGAPRAPAHPHSKEAHSGAICSMMCMSLWEIIHIFQPSLSILARFEAVNASSEWFP